MCSNLRVLASALCKQSLPIEDMEESSEDSEASDDDEEREARARSGVPPLDRLLFGLAVDAEFCDRPRLNTLKRDLFATALALAVDPLLDLRERLLDLADQSALSLAESPLEGEVHLRRSSIDLIGEIVGIEMDIARKRLLSIPHELVTLPFEDLLELRHVTLLQRFAPSLFRRSTSGSKVRAPADQLVSTVGVRGSWPQRVLISCLIRLPGL